MASEKTKNTLKDLGLTEYETRAYIGLVSSGPSTAGDLSEASNVPHSRIYDVLSKLEKKGWIESQSGRPARYRAKPPSEALRLLKIKQEQNLKRASETIQQELEPLYEEGGEVEKPDIWTIRGNREILERMEVMLTRSEIEVLISISSLPEEFSDIRNFARLVETKDLDLRILISEENDLIREIAKSSNAQVRFRSPLFGGGMVVDGRETLLILGGEGRMLGIWSEEEGLAKYAKEYFEYLWEDSEKGDL